MYTSLQNSRQTIQLRPVFSTLGYWKGVKDPTDPYNEGDQDKGHKKQKNYPNIQVGENHFEDCHVEIPVSLGSNEIGFVVEPRSDEPSHLCTYKGQGSYSDSYRDQILQCCDIFFPLVKKLDSFHHVDYRNQTPETIDDQVQEYHEKIGIGISW